jgi:hypothetical protein
MGIDGQAWPDHRAIMRKVATTPIGDTIALSVWRPNHSEEATLQVQPWPHMMAPRSREPRQKPARLCRPAAFGATDHTMRQPGPQRDASLQAVIGPLNAFGMAFHATGKAGDFVNGRAVRRSHSGRPAIC